MIPETSKDKYDFYFSLFLGFIADYDVEVDAVNEELLLAFFKDMSDFYAPNTLWTIFSCVKKKLLIHTSIDIGKFPLVTQYLKKKNDKYLPKKALTFEPDEIKSFLRDSGILGQIKLAILIGLFGGLRNCELYNIQFKDIVRLSDRLVVTIASSKTDKKRAGFSFIVPSNQETALNPLHYFDQYANLVPPDLNTGPFFLTVQPPRGKRYFPKVIKTRRGINWFGSLPVIVATFLKKSEPKLYTGHSLRRTAATWLAAHGITEVQLQTFGR